VTTFLSRKHRESGDGTRDHGRAIQGGNHLIFIAGQAGVDASGAVVGGDNVEEQTEQAFRNLSAVRASDALSQT
jgi:enamine deaminase RidA (YjgF/YER057c/UK114 family)